jgi:mannobiose 2-epimerase
MIRTYAERELRRKAEEELTRNILPFWMKHVPDGRNGGFYGKINNDMTLDADAPNGLVLCARILWTFSAASRSLNDSTYMPMARRAYEYLMAHYYDSDYGGYYWTVDNQGNPLDDTKSTYGQAFVLYALAEFHLATGDPNPLVRAIELYRVLEEDCRDYEFKGYKEAFKRDWTGSVLSALCRGNPDYKKTMNTQLHIMEAYTTLLNCWKEHDMALREALSDLIELTINKIMDQEDDRQRLFFTNDWIPVSQEISFGHDIESSWLIMEAANALQDERLIALASDAAKRLAAATLIQGVDRDGGIYNKQNADGSLDLRKEWWPQAEAVVGFLEAYTLTGDAKYKDAAIASWQFIERYMIDEKNGEWFSMLSEDGVPLASKPKVDMWKCPYHNGRACLEIMKRVGE